MSASIEPELVGPLAAAIAGWTVTWLVAWALVWRRKAVRWPVLVGLAPLAMVLVALPFLTELSFFAIPSGIVVGFVFTIGFLKLIIAAAGRRGVVAGSSVKASAPTARPRGLVE